MHLGWLIPCPRFIDWYIDWCTACSHKFWYVTGLTDVVALWQYRHYFLFTWRMRRSLAPIAYWGSLDVKTWLKMGLFCCLNLFFFFFFPSSQCPDFLPCKMFFQATDPNQRQWNLGGKCDVNEAFIKLHYLADTDSTQVIHWGSNCHTSCSFLMGLELAVVFLSEFIEKTVLDRFPVSSPEKFLNQSPCLQRLEVVPSLLFPLRASLGSHTSLSHVVWCVHWIWEFSTKMYMVAVVFTLMINAFSSVTFCMQRGEKCCV